MDTQSTHTQRTRKNHYGAGSSRGTRSATTLLAQVADLERGQRIKARRVELHLTQPALVDLIEDLAKTLPETHALHPEKAGKAPVTLRGLQTWEQGGGVAWEKAKLLAGALQTDARWLINGVPEDEPTPDPFAGREPELLERVEQLLIQQNALLARQSAILERIEAATRRVDEASHDLAAASAEAGRGLRDAPARPRRVAKAPARKPKPRA